jgi:hypothetical protein
MNCLRTWIRLAIDPSIFTRALTTAAVVGVILTLVNHGAEVLGGRLRPDHVWPIAFTFIVPFVVATASGVAVLRRTGSEPGAGALSGSGVEAVQTFPEANPNPVLRISASGLLLYANPASAPLLRAIQSTVGDRLQADLVAGLRAAADPAASRTVDVEAEGRTYRLRAVAIGAFGFLHVYGSAVNDSEVVETNAA